VLSATTALAYRRTAHAIAVDAELGRPELLVAYGGGALAIAAVACLAFGAIAAMAAAADPPTGVATG